MSRSNLIYMEAARNAARDDSPMTGAERLDELQWLMDAGVHPTHAAAQLGTNVAAAVKLARDHGRDDLAAHVDRKARRADLYPGKTVNRPTGLAA